MEDLDHIISDATLAIEPEYFRLPIYDGDSVYRERVYCYELYHRMRAVWPPASESSFRLNAEVDKKGHRAMALLGVKGQKPDFLVHQPGNMDGNHSVIEVKPAPSQARLIRKDLETLSAFLQAGYDRAIYLIYGHLADARMVARILDKAAKIDATDGIEIWSHVKPGTPAVRVALVK